MVANSDGVNFNEEENLKYKLVAHIDGVDSNKRKIEDQGWLLTTVECQEVSSQNLEYQWYPF